MVKLKSLERRRPAACVLPALERAKASVERMKEQRFFTWATPELALLCDRDAPLEPGCHVAWVENRYLCSHGKLLTKHPERAKALTVDLEEWPEGEPTVHRLRKSDVVRIIGTYQGEHPLGCLPDNKGAISATRMLRPALWGDGTPIPTCKPLPLGPIPELSKGRAADLEQDRGAR